jgi:WD40 repeat protein
MLPASFCYTCVCVSAKRVLAHFVFSLTYAILYFMCRFLPYRLAIDFTNRVKEVEPLGVVGTWAALRKQNPPPEVLYGHSRMITGICVSKDGRYLASCCLAGRVVLWDYKKKELLHEFIFRKPGKSRFFLSVCLSVSMFSLQ